MCRKQQREEEGYGLRELEEEQPEKKRPLRRRTLEETGT